MSEKIDLPRSTRPAKNIVSKGSLNEINLRIIFFVRFASRRLRNWIKRPSWKFLHVDTEFISRLVSNVTKHVKFWMGLLNYDNEIFLHDRFFVSFFWVNEKIVLRTICFSILCLLNERSISLLIFEKIIIHQFISVTHW